MGFINNSDNECFDTEPLQVAEEQWKRDFTKVRPGTAKIVGHTITRPTFSEVLIENQEKVSKNDINFFNSRRMS